MPTFEQAYLSEVIVRKDKRWYYNGTAVPESVYWYSADVFYFRTFERSSPIEFINVSLSIYVTHTPSATYSN